MGTTDNSNNFCSKLGVNGGNFPDEKVFQEMNTYGFTWYMGLITGEGGKDTVINAINTASKYDIKIILRICWGNYTSWNCDFNPITDSSAGSRYAKLINDVASSVSTEFWAIAGHNEPNANEKVEASIEREFMKQVLDGVNDRSKVHLLSPIMDLHAAPSDEYPNAEEADKYLKKLDETGLLDSLDGIAGNTYEFTNPGQKITDRIDKLNKTLSEKNLNKQIYITETGPIVPDNLENFKDSLTEVLGNSNIEAVLIFKPEVLADAGPHITWDQAKELASKCSKEGGKVVSCAFEKSEYLMKSCSVNNSWGVARGLYLEVINDSLDNPQWEGEGEWQAKINNLPTLRYYASTNVPGEDTDSVPYGAMHNRLNFEEIYISNEKTYLNFNKSSYGYGVIRGEGGGVLFKLQYEAGEGSLIYVTDFPDPSSEFRVAEQLLETEEEYTKTKKDKTLSEKIMIDTSRKSESLFAWLALNKCKGTKYEFKNEYKEDETQGYWTKVDHVVYPYDLAKIIKDSNLMDIIGQSCNKESGTIESGSTDKQCKIATDLSHCNNCWEYQVPIDPLQPTLGYTTEHDCDNLLWKGGGEIKTGRKQVLSSCLLNTDIYVRHTTQEASGMELSVNQILEGAWKAQVMMNPTDKRICNPNFGIKVEAESKLVDVKLECGGGTGAGCENNLLNNGTFGEGSRLPNGTTKQEWSGTPVYWYPFWNPNPPGEKYDCNVYKEKDCLKVFSPEIGIVPDNVNDNRKSDGEYVKVFTPESIQRYDAGLFQEIWFSDIVPANTKIIVSAKGQANNGYTGHDNSDYKATDDFKLYVALKYGTAIEDLKSKGPENENYQLSNFDNYVSVKNSASQTNDSSDPPGFIEISLGDTYTLTQETDKITIFVRGIETNACPTCPNKLQSFWDSVCVTLPERPDITNVFPKEEATAYPWSGEITGGYCKPDPETTLNCSVGPGHPQAQKTINLFYPLLGTGVKILKDTAITDYALYYSQMKDCPTSGDITEACYCQEDQYDPLTEYLYDNGFIDTYIEESWAKKVLASPLPYEDEGEEGEGNLPGDDYDTDDVVGTCDDTTKMPLYLPFEGTQKAGSTWYNGSTHQTIPAMDFGGTFNVLASRGGIIVALKDDSNIYGWGREFNKYANYVTIYHPEYDLYTSYVHLKQNSIPEYLKVGIKIRKGQFLGISDTTGYASGPHLHFNVNYNVNDQCKTLDTCWNYYYSDKYCFVEYPDTDWKTTSQIYVTSKNKMDTGEPDEGEYLGPDIDATLMDVLGNVSEEISLNTGKCVPKAMLAAIMSIETNTNYTASQLKTKFPDPSKNSTWCSNINISCTGTNTPAVASDEAIDSYYKDVILKNDNCKLSPPNTSTIECNRARTYQSPYPPYEEVYVHCCDVRGPMQFLISTWMGYKPYVGDISKKVLKHFNFTIDDYYSAKRERLIDSIVASGLMLKTDCHKWEDDEENTVKTQAGKYGGGGKSNSSYALSVLSRYNEFKNYNIY